jgi:hypothetical protein
MDPTWRLGASLADYAGILILSFLYKVCPASVLFVFAIS